MKQYLVGGHNCYVHEGSPGAYCILNVIDGSGHELYPDGHWGPLSAEYFYKSAEEAHATAEKYDETPKSDNVSQNHDFKATHTLPVGSEERKGYPVCEGVLRYFPAAIAAAAKVSKHGNDKHNPGEPLHHARGKSTDHGDCILRHLIDLPEDFGKGVGYDENGLPQVGYLVWRALALAQEWLEKHEGAPLAPNARV